MRKISKARRASSLIHSVMHEQSCERMYELALNTFFRSRDSKIRSNITLRTESLRVTRFFPQWFDSALQRNQWASDCTVANPRLTVGESRDILRSLGNFRSSNRGSFYGVFLFLPRIGLLGTVSSGELLFVVNNQTNPRGDADPCFFGRHTPRFFLGVAI